MGNATKGGCGIFNSQIEQLLSKHKETIVKFICVEEGTKAVESKFVQIKRAATSLFNQKTGDAYKLAEQPAKMFDDLVSNVKQNLNSKMPGGVELVQKMKGQKLQNILGMGEVKGKIDGLVSVGKKEVDEKKGSLLNGMDTFKSQLVNTMQKQKPQIPIYSSLPKFVQNEVYEEVSAQAKDQIQKHKDEAVASLSDKIKPQNLVQGLMKLQAVDKAKGELLQKKGEWESKIEELTSKLKEGQGMLNKITSFF